MMGVMVMVMVLALALALVVVEVTGHHRLIEKPFLHYYCLLDFEMDSS